MKLKYIIIVIMLMISGCSHQNKLIKKNIPLILYGEAVEEGKDFWSLGFEEIKNSTTFSTALMHCQNDFSENISLHEVRKNNKNGIIYFLFEGTSTNDLMIVYVYDSIKKVFLFKFRIPLS